VLFKIAILVGSLSVIAQNRLAPSELAIDSMSRAIPVAAPQAFDCPKKEAVHVGGGFSTSGTSRQCGNGDSCGQVTTYNPPTSSSCRDSTEMLCCVLQEQRAYTITYSCVDTNRDGVTECIAGAKSYIGAKKKVYVTVDCWPNGCGVPEEY
jgi:hypothetical protein